MTDPGPAYAELHCHSYFSLLDGASSPEELVQTAQANGLHALALTDHDSLAGVVRFWKAAQRTGLHAIIGAEVTLEDDSHLTLLAETQEGYANLCRLISASRLDQLPKDDSQPWPGKVAPSLRWETLAQHASGLIALTGCRHGPVAVPLRKDDIEAATQATFCLRDIFGPEHFFVELQHHDLFDDDSLLRRLCNVARTHDLSVVATNNVHYATTESSPLRDALIAIRHNTTLTAARRAGLLPINSRYALPTPQEMAYRFSERPDALANTIAIAERCQVAVDFSHRRLPVFPVPEGHSEFSYLYALCHENLPKRYPALRPEVLTQLAHELAIIEQAGLAGYFLIVYDIVRFARQAKIRCQGRGSAANSIVAYLLHITNIDPLAHNLLFERFLSPDKFTTPDIDLDFAADRREEVIQYVYQRYGAAHTAMVCNVITYQARSAIRDLGKALDFPPPVIDRLAKSLDTYSATRASEELLAQVEDDAPAHHPLRLLAGLVRRIDGCPRHLSIHSGGMLIAGPRLDEVVPLEPATMPGRVICQWDKDSVEDAGLIKLDVLGLRTLGLISEALSTIEALEGEAPDLDNLSLDDPAIFEMLRRADTVGTFQVESRAQQQMLPRLKPEKFEDIIIEIAIVRPGPIQGGAVHPYLRRRAGLEPVTYVHPCLEPVLRETLGVLLFQEQAIRVATAAAGFNAGEADMLRRALSRSRPDEEMQAMAQRFLEGALKKEIPPDLAKAIFQQLSGFAGYGFCKSHSASFALIAYQTLHLKHYYPAAFYCALLNHQPMGFYRPEVIIGDAKRHGIDVLPVDINRSAWKYTVERREDEETGVCIDSLRAGLCAVSGLGEQAWQRIEEARTAGLFDNLGDFCRRTHLPRDVTSNLIRAGALDAFGTRRDLLWRLGELDYRPDKFDLVIPTIKADLPPLDPLEQTVWEYELMGLSPLTHIVMHYREALRAAGIRSTWEVKHLCEAGQRVRVAGMVVVRQRPGTAKGMTFLSLEDESGLLDVVIRPDVYAKVRDTLRSNILVIADGVVQRSHSERSGSVSVLLYQLSPLR